MIQKQNVQDSITELQKVGYSQWLTISAKAMIMCTTWQPISAKACETERHVDLVIDILGNIAIDGQWQCYLTPIV